MPVTYTDYAEETLKVREISKEDIKSTLLNPIRIVEGKKKRKIEVLSLSDMKSR